MDFSKKLSKVFYGWYIVTACSIIAIYVSGVVYFGFTAVFEPIAEDFHWTYAQVSIAASLIGLERGILSPLMGILVDRYGPRKLIFIGSILMCLGFLLLSRISSLTMFYVAYAAIAIGMSTCVGTVLMTAVTNWFQRRAGLVIGIVASGFGLGGLFVPIVTKIIDVLQWRMAMDTVGLGMLVIVLPLSLIIRHKPEDYGYQPDGNIGNIAETQTTQTSFISTEVNISAKQALRTRAFWSVAIAALCQMFVVSAAITHMMPYLSSLGFTRSFSSLVALLIPVVSIVSRLSSGWLSDKFGSRYVFTISFAFITIGMLLFGFVSPDKVWLIIPFIIALSFGWGCSITIRIALLRKYFGRGSFGTIFGFVSGMMMLGNISGAPLAGWIFDTWGSYQWAWLSYSAVALLGTIMAFTIPSFSSTNQKTEQL